MDAVGRKAFWDTLCSLEAYDHESAQKLVAAAPYPPELCRFRAVNENSLLQLQKNEQFFSTANYYDDPFDTYFFINFQMIQDGTRSVRQMLDQDKTEPIKEFLSQVGLGDHLESIIQALKSASLNMDLVKYSLREARSLIQKQIYSICFCEESLNETMWLKYADQHKGFVQVYDFQNPDTFMCGKESKCGACGMMNSSHLILPVYYSNEMYDATAYAMGVLYREALKMIEPLPQELIDIYIRTMAWQSEKVSLIKKECHQYDQEWRMLLSNAPDIRPRIRLKPKSVLIGLRTPEYQKCLIISAARCAGIEEIYQVYINDNNLLDKKRIMEE